jgi:hypothetical protein
MTHGRKLSVVAVLVMLGAMFITAEAQDNQSRLATANGQGTLRVGEERFKINTVIVKLMDDRKAEITLVSDITVFLTGTWSNHGEAQEEVDFEVTGGASPGGLEGRGKVILTSDGKSVTRLSLKGMSRTTKRALEANFASKS